MLVFLLCGVGFARNIHPVIYSSWEMSKYSHLYGQADGYLEEISEDSVGLTWHDHAIQLVGGISPVLLKYIFHPETVFKIPLKGGHYALGKAEVPTPLKISIQWDGNGQPVLRSDLPFRYWAQDAKGDDVYQRVTLPLERLEVFDASHIVPVSFQTTNLVLVDQFLDGHSATPYGTYRKNHFVVIAQSNVHTLMNPPVTKNAFPFYIIPFRQTRWKEQPLLSTPATDDPKLKRFHYGTFELKDFNALDGTVQERIIRSTYFGPSTEPVVNGRTFLERFNQSFYENIPEEVPQRFLRSVAACLHHVLRSLPTESADPATVGRNPLRVIR